MMVRAGCWLLIVATLVATIVFWRVISFVGLAILAVLVAGLLWHEVMKRLAVRRFRAEWGPQGKDLLLVSSNSPRWQVYVEENWLPKWGERAVLLNWSERRLWRGERRSEVELFAYFSGNEEFNPLAIVVPPRGLRVNVVRFFEAFKAFKVGKPEALAAAEAELERLLAEKGGRADG